MKFGFSAWTDEAREMIEKLGIHYERKEGLVEIYSERIDMTQQLWAEKQPAFYERGLMPPEMKKEYRAQKTRIWKNPYTGNYYYLWEDVVFKGERRVKLDYATNPPTQFDFLLLDVVPPQDQESMRDILIQVVPNANIEEGGVLL